MARRRKKKIKRQNNRNRSSRQDGKKLLQALKSKRLREYGTRPPACQYCGGKPVLERNGDNALWVCSTAGCDARVGCHHHSTIPLGTLADRELREARGRTHRVLDLIWEHKHMPRDQVYVRLAEAMGLPREQTHIGMFDLGQCEFARAFARVMLREIYGGDGYGSEC